MSADIDNRFSPCDGCYERSAGYVVLRSRARCALFLVILSAAILAFGVNRAAALSVTANPPTSSVFGADRVKPAKDGCANAPSMGCYYNINTTNFKPYRFPGQAEDPQGDPCRPNDPNAKSYAPGDKFFVAYANSNQPVQSSDWWTSIGLQTPGWVIARGAPLITCSPPLPNSATLASTLNFYSEPFQFHFVDFNSSWPTLKGLTGEHGLSFWNSNTATVITNSSTIVNNQTKYNSNFDTVTWGSAAPSEQAIVTIGLDGVHPLREDEFPSSYPPSGQPPTNIRVQRYSDWGVVTSYTDKTATNQVNITMANGSPFVWFERVKGSPASAPFDAWVGGLPTQNTTMKNPPNLGSYTELLNSGTLLVVSVNTFYGVPGTVAPSSALYAIYADQGTWKAKFNATQNPFPTMQLYQNNQATAVVVTALPHNVSGSNFATVWKTIQPFACRKTVGTQLNYPPNQMSTIVNGMSIPLGYNQANATVTGELKVTTQPIASFPGCTAGPPLQLIFPHHRKVLLAAQKANIGSSLVWNSLMGPAFSYTGDSMVMQMPVKGMVPLFPGSAIDSTSITNPTMPSQTAGEDIYDTLKLWYFRQEPAAPGQVCDMNGCRPQPTNLGSFATNADTYLTPASNTYINFTTTVRELIIVADELANSSNPKLNVLDPDLGKTKKQVAAEIRDGLLQTFKEMMGAWFDIFSSQLFQYDTVFNSLYGYPAGFGDVQSFNDHHFHYGYFLRAMAALARYDKSWIASFQGSFNDLIGDVANFNRTSTRFPVLREFNPFYGHSWAAGAAYNGNDQESSSEAINFEVGMIEVGDLLGNTNLRNLGLYLYEQEILSTQQYWFNQDASLTDTPAKPGDACPTGASFSEVASTPPVCYNGNWPRSFVTYKRTADGSTQRHTLITRVMNADIDRTTFFDANPIAAYTIEAIPAGPSMTYLGRNQNWFMATWNQFISDSNFYQLKSNFGPDLEVYQNVMAGMQTLLPTSGTGFDGTGRNSALMRINRVHPYFPAAMNTTMKYMAYTLDAFGQIDANWVANWPEAEVFSKSGARTFVVYNPTASAISVSFTNLTTKATAGPFSVAPGAVVAQPSSGGGNSKFVPTSFVAPTSRLYFRADGSLTPTPGTKIPPNIITSFPVDNSAVSQTLTTIPVRSDSMNLQFPPPPSGVIIWKGTFSGTLVGSSASHCMPLKTGAPVVCDPIPISPPTGTPPNALQATTRFAIYTDQCLLAGWQNCSNKNSAGNTYSVRISYYFDATKCNPIKGTGGTCNANRVEFYGGVPMFNSNTFGLHNRSTEYFLSGVNLGKPGIPNQPAPLVTSGFDGTFGLNLMFPPGTCGGTRSDGTPTTWDPSKVQPPGPCGIFNDATGQPVPPSGLFWQTVKQGVVTVELWGGAIVPNRTIAVPIPVSVDTGLVANRASWIQPPYAP